ncbi:hypothetical protein BsIDN1_29330 [Bacillus safensis]|uniref:Uncharacterized protein n=1 Tax=Bacillus safensis TaxID=561879 RepID=A0A5S9M8Y0_BACIA|nr:hypothetical protein BsIDN1_29330 [Bacillus safensis]
MVIDPAIGLQGYQAREVAFKINIPTKLVGQAVKFMTSLYTMRLLKKIVQLLRLIHLL